MSAGYFSGGKELSIARLARRCVSRCSVVKPLSSTWSLVTIETTERSACIASGLAAAGVKPASSRISSAISVRSSPVGFRMTCALTRSATWGCGRIAVPSAVIAARMSPTQSPLRSGSSMASRTRSARPESRSSLVRKCQYSAMGVTPSSVASRRMVTASIPSASAITRARSATTSRLSEARVSDFVGDTVDNYTTYGVACTSYLYKVHVRRRGARSMTTPPTTSRRPWALLAVALATFMTYLDNNIVNVALPAIQRDLHLTTSGLEWIVSGYILVFAGFLLAGGRLADAYGRRRLFLIGLTIFTGASLAAGLADSTGMLVAARAVQGLGAALVTPTTLAIISAAYADPRERASAVGI